MKKLTRLGLCAMLALLASSCNENGTYEEDVPGASCTGTSFKMCSDVCTDIRTDINNCGDCAVTCNASTQVCTAGKCTSASKPSTTTNCAAGQSKCDDGLCYNLSTNAKNCGACGNVCGNNQVCTNGKCTTSSATCTNGKTECNGSCYDLNSDSNNCGKCGIVCGDGSSCQNGACKSNAPQCSNDNDCEGAQVCDAGVCKDPSAPTCGKDQALCGSECKDILTDNDNCGECGNLCSESASCKNGVCKIDAYQCSNDNDCEGAQVCDAGVCKDPSAPTCGKDQALCGSECKDILTDNDNCGKCGIACGDGASCQDGTCKSNAPQCTVDSDCADTEECNEGTCDAIACTTEAGVKLCSRSCVNTLTDNNNCGDCGKACSDDETCNSGHCEKQAVSCNTAPKTTNCSDVCVDITSDANNCGACGSVCSSDQECSSSTCVCKDSKTLCSGTCIDTTSDKDNCGACGMACGADQSCSASACVCDDAAKTLCDGACIDTTSDNNNCGACGNVCKDGETCSSGACVSSSTPDGCVGGYKTVTIDGASVKAYCIGDLTTLRAVRDGLGTTGKGYPDANNKDNAFVLTSDIDIYETTAWKGMTLIGGKFSGDGHTIKSAKLGCVSTAKQCALFASLDSSTVADLTANITVEAGSMNYAAAVAGVAKNSTIANVKSIGTSISGGSYVAGIVASSNGSTIKNCSSSSSVSGTSSVGGLVGYAQNATSITDSSSSGAVSGTKMVGGIVGDIDANDKASIKNSSAKGDVTSSDVIAGGIVGRALSGSIDHCISVGNVSGKSQVGGIVGTLGNSSNLKGKVANSASKGNITATNTTAGIAGGIVGDFYNTKTAGDVRVSNSFSMGNIAGYTAAGILGTSQKATGSSTNTINNVYATGAVTATAKNPIAVTGKGAALTINGYYWDGMWASMTSYTLASGGAFSYDASSAAVVDASALADKLNAIAADKWVTANCLLSSGPATAAATYKVPVLKDYTAEDLEVLGCEL